MFKKTKLAKYGTENIMECAEVKNKIKQTVLNKYGVTNVMQDSNIKAKCITTERKRVYDRMCELAKQESISPLFTLEEFKGTYANNIYKWKCNICGNIITQNYASSRIPICRKCHPLTISSGQSELIEFIQANLNSNHNLVINTKDIITPYELDIYLPELKLAFEFNGDYWHSDKCRKDKTYHITKTRLCELKNIKLIHIWEYQWKNPSLQRKIKNRIKYLLGKTERIYARNCTVKRIDTKAIVDNFLDENHLQGSINSKVNLGLYNKDQLVALMTFGKPRFNKNYQWELLRFASSKQVVGGASKLLKYFEKEYKPNSLISYANYAWGNGNLYQQLGFSFTELSDPSYVWVKTRDTYQYVYTRYQTQKYKLKDLLGKDNFDPNKSETDNMLDNGFLKLYDCGNLVFVKEYC